VVLGCWPAVAAAVVEKRCRADWLIFLAPLDTFRLRGRRRVLVADAWWPVSPSKPPAPFSSGSDILLDSSLFSVIYSWCGIIRVFLGFLESGTFEKINPTRPNLLHAWLDGLATARHSANTTSYMNDLVKVLVIFIRQARLGGSSALRPRAVPVPLCSISRMGRK
jgi:hypothetical protein